MHISGQLDNIGGKSHLLHIHLSPKLFKTTRWRNKEVKFIDVSLVFTSFIKSKTFNFNEKLENNFQF